VTSLNISRAVTAVIDQTLKHGGATESLIAGVETPVSGYAVSIPGREAVNHLLLDGELRREAMAETLYAYAERNRTWLAQPGYYLGAWLDGDRFVVDVTQVTPELGQAVRAGVERDQDAIYNLADGRELFLKRKRVSTLTDEQMTVWRLLDTIDPDPAFEVVGEVTVTLKPQPGDLDHQTLTELVEHAVELSKEDSNDAHIAALGDALEEALKQLHRADLAALDFA
jgi:hypothetical protein